jgi:hypothetical protein
LNINELRKLLKIVLDYTQAIAYICTMKNEKKLNKHAQALGRIGGKAGRGKAKARTSEQARAAVMARWNKVKREEN